MRPDDETAIHVLVYSCAHCNATPICGPAYISQKTPGKALCILCFLTVAPEKRALYRRLEPPLAWDEETMVVEEDVGEDDVAEKALGGQVAKAAKAQGATGSNTQLTEAEKIANQMKQNMLLQAQLTANQQTIQMQMQLEHQRNMRTIYAIQSRGHSLW